MRRHSLFAGARIAAIVLGMILVPFAALAQTATTTQSSSGLGNDTGTTPAQQMAALGWRQSGPLQQQISALSPTPVMALQIPILFGVNIGDFTPNFGDPRPGGRTHEGEDILAPLDTPIVSPTAGVVLRTEVGASEGNAVYEAAPGGYTYVYMHLDKFGEGVAAGEVLQQGSLIGYVGNTGDAAGGPTHLHFEVHDPSGTPIDPMPFLTLTFTPQQKITFLNTILGQTSDSVALAQLLVTNFRTTFTDDEQSSITLPPLITGALATVPATTAPSSAFSASLPPGDLDLGSSGAAVVSLQTFLINKNTGPAAARLAGAGATGNFGTITQAALIEYQTSVGISPADGYYGPATRTLVQSSAPTASTTPVATAPVPVPQNSIIPTAPASGVLVLPRDLSIGMTGSDVQSLQKFLNAHGFTVAASGAGSAGQETTYFGPATLAAVIRYQTAHSISPQVGYVGPITRASISALS